MHGERFSDFGGFEQLGRIGIDDFEIAMQKPEEHSDNARFTGTGACVITSGTIEISHEAVEVVYCDGF